MRWFRSMAALVVTTCAAACGSGAEDQVLRLDVGTAIQGRFVPLADGDTLLLQRGCQGSQHVSVSLRATGLSDPGSVRVFLSLVRMEDNHRLSVPFEVRLPFLANSSGGEVRERLAIPLVVPEPSEALGIEVLLEAGVVDSEGRHAEASRVALVKWGPDAC